MFTGLVETMGQLVKRTAEGSACRLRIAARELLPDVSIGDSIAVNGCCLTVIELGEETFDFQAGEETLRCTNLGALRVAERVNLERSLRVSDRLGGHFVTGHVDGVGTVQSRTDAGEWSTTWFSLPAPLARFVAPKGCIAVDGVSLTVVDVRGTEFSVALIPHTLQQTTLGVRQAGDSVNIETDLLAKYVLRP